MSSTVSIQFTGKIPKKIQTLGEDKYMDAAMFYASLLFKGVELDDPCMVDINFTKPDGGYLGLCEYHGDGEVEITINPSQSLRSSLIALAHEMVHARQFVTGEMKDSSKGVDYTVWKGKQIQISALNYYDLPWEIDALGREYGLYRRWIESRKYQYTAPWANTDL